MRVLAIESAMMGGSVALLDGELLLGEVLLDSKQRTARTLAPAIQQLLTESNWKPKSVELIAVTSGPGSFTGLRIGVTTAKSFAYATGAGLVGVNTLHVLARQVPTSERTLWVVMNAERDQLFVSSFQTKEATWTEVSPTRIMDRDTWLGELAANDIVSGPALRELAGQLPSEVHPADPSLWIPRAATVGRLGFQRFQEGGRDDVWTLVPNYFRESAAEEKARGG